MWKLCGIQQKLNMQGHYISDTEFSNTLLTSLPNSWLAFITAVNANRAGKMGDILMAQVLDGDCA